MPRYNRPPDLIRSIADTQRVVAGLQRTTLSAGAVAVSLGQWVTIRAGAVTAPAFTDVAACYAQTGGGRPRVDALCTVTAGTIAEVGLTDPLGNLVGAAVTVTASGQATITPDSWPDTPTDGVWTLSARATTGQVTVTGVGFWEVP